MKDKTKQGELLPGELTREVREMDAINFRGNIIPPVWLQQLVNKNGKPNVAAIFILGDVVYWYQPAEIREEQTGRVVGKRRRFEGDFLRRSYADIEKQFGFTKRVASLALDILEMMDLVHRIVRPFQQGNMTQPNTMYLRPVPKNIARLNAGAWLRARNHGSDVEVTTVVTPTSPRWLRARSDNTVTTTVTTTDILSTQREPKKAADAFQEFADREAAAGLPPNSARPPFQNGVSIPNLVAGGITSGPAKLTGDEGGEYVVFQSRMNAPEMEDRRRGHFPLEMDYLQRVQLGAKISEQEAARVMVYYLTETDEGKSLYSAYLEAVNAESGELANVKLICASIAAKSDQYQLRNWRRMMLSRLLNFMKVELASERRAAERAKKQGAAAGAMQGQLKAVTDNPSQFDYSEKSGFNGK